MDVPSGTHFLIAEALGCAAVTTDWQPAAYSSRAPRWGDHPCPLPDPQPLYDCTYGATSLCHTCGSYSMLWPLGSSTSDFESRRGLPWEASRPAGARRRWAGWKFIEPSFPRADVPTSPDGCWWWNSYMSLPVKGRTQQHPPRTLDPVAEPCLSTPTRPGRAAPPGSLARERQGPDALVHEQARSERLRRRRQGAQVQGRCASATREGNTRGCIRRLVAAAWIDSRDHDAEDVPGRLGCPHSRALRPPPTQRARRRAAALR